MSEKEPKGWPDVSYEEFVDYLKGMNEFRENDPWIPSEETYKEMRESRRESLEFSERFNGFVRASKECSECELPSVFKYLGGRRSKVELIFECPNKHELRFYYGSFDKVER